MAKKGLRYCIFGEYGSGNGFYTNSRQLSPIAGLTGRVNQKITKVVKDGCDRDIDVEVTGGLLSLELNSDQDDIYNYLLGHDNSGSVIFNSLDQPPFVGVGVIGVSSEGYKAKIYTMVKFHEPVDEYKTKGENIEFKHLMLEGDIFIPDNGDWKKEETFDTLDEAIAYLGAVFIMPTGRNLFVNTLAPDKDHLPKLREQAVNTSTNGSFTVLTHGVKTKGANNSLQIVFGSTSNSSMTLNGIDAGKTYTLSFDAAWKAGSAGTSQSAAYIRLSIAYRRSDSPSTTTLQEDICQITNDNRGTEMSQRVEYTFDLPETTTGFYIRFNYTGANNAASDYLSMDNIKLEEGSTATAWTPAPEDLGGN